LRGASGGDEGPLAELYSSCCCFPGANGEGGFGRPEYEAWATTSGPCIPQRNLALEYSSGFHHVHHGGYWVALVPYNPHGPCDSLSLLHPLSSILSILHILYPLASILYHSSPILYHILYPLSSILYYISSILYPLSSIPPLSGRPNALWGGLKSLQVNRSKCICRRYYHP
jgi:hypothetical protein